MDQRFFLTTTLPYVNAQPHVGHALEFVQADAIVRFLRLTHGEEAVHFNVGTDEHGQKIRKKAEELGIEVNAFILQNVQTFVDFCELFSISYDSFYRTSDPDHHMVAQAFWNQCAEKGLIEKKQYSGQYCVGCESFKKDKDLVNGHCPDHPGGEITTIAEENYFFLMTQLRDHLLERFDDNAQFLQPASKRDELRNYLVDIEDLSISRRRENLPRGVPVPGDADHVMYVRFDALSNYVGACGFPHPSFLDRWSNSIQLCGPDNLRFQGGIWQAMLAGIDAPHTSKLLVHGTILGPDGNKMSKSVGNTISPYDQQQKWGTDAVRLYLLAGIPTYGDGSYQEKDLVNLYNSWMCDSLGNLINRVLVLAKKYFVDLSEDMDESVDESIQPLVMIVYDAFSVYQLYDACQGIHKISLYANKYFDEQKPRDKEINHQQRAKVLKTVYTIALLIVDLYQPVMPDAMERCATILATKQPAIPFEKLVFEE